MKKFLIGLLICAFLASSGCAIYYGIQYNNIDQNQVTDNSGLVQTVNELRETIKKITQEKEGLSVEVANLQKDKAGLEAKQDVDAQLIASLQADKASLIQAKAQVDSNLATAQETINSLNAQIAEKDNAITALQAQYDARGEEINNLNSQILSLQNEITRLNGLLASYEYLANETFEVNFYNGETLVTTKAVRNNTSLTESQVPTLTDEKDIFLGWTKTQNGTELVTVANEVVTADITYYAVWTRRAEVKFVDGDNVIDTSLKVKGTNVVAPANPSKAGFEFLGWAKSPNGEIVLVTEELVTEDVTYYAVWTEKYVVTYVDGTTTLSTEEVVAGNKANVPSAPTKSGWTFDGWYRNGVKITTSNFKPTADTTLKAQYYKWNSLNMSPSYGASIKDLSTYTINGLKAGDKVRATFTVGVSYYTDEDGNWASYTYTTNNQFAYGGTAKHITETSFYASGPVYSGDFSVSISFSCKSANTLNISQSASVTNPDNDINISSLYLYGVEVRQNLYTL